MNCLETREALSAWSDGELEGLPAEALRHQESCAECQAAGAAFARLGVELQSFYRQGCPPASHYRWPTAAMGRAVSRRRLWAGLGGLAAAALLALALGLRWWPGTPAVPAGFARYHLEGADGGAGRLEAEGAQIWLSPGTRLEVVASRKLEQVQGVAYFKVEAGAFEIATPAGTVSVLGTEFSVKVIDANVRVTVREGKVRLSSAQGELTLSRGEAAELTSAAPPKSIPASPMAAELLWAPWSFLSPDEQTERLSLLREWLSEEDYERRLEARACLERGGPEGVPAWAVWTGAEPPRLRLETVLILGRMTGGHATVRTLLQESAKRSTEQTGIRTQAVVALGAAGMAEDLAFLGALLKDVAEPSELRAAAARAAEQIEARVRKSR